MESNTNPNQTMSISKGKRHTATQKQTKVNEIVNM